jgi:hypothetical protein
MTAKYAGGAHDELARKDFLQNEEEILNLMKELRII